MTLKIVQSELNSICRYNICLRFETKENLNDIKISHKHSNFHKPTGLWALTAFSSLNSGVIFRIFRIFLFTVISCDIYKDCQCVFVCEWAHTCTGVHSCFSVSGLPFAPGLVGTAGLCRRIYLCTLEAGGCNGGRGLLTAEGSLWAAQPDRWIAENWFTAQRQACVWSEHQTEGCLFPVSCCSVSGASINDGVNHVVIWKCTCTVGFACQIWQTRGRFESWLRGEIHMDVQHSNDNNTAGRNDKKRVHKCPNEIFFAHFEINNYDPDFNYYFRIQRI